MRKEENMHITQQHNKAIIAFIFLLSCLFIVSCKQNKSSKSIVLKYGIEFNPVRSFIGLEPINRNWESHSNKFKHVNHPSFIRIDWWDKATYPGKVIKKPCYACKSIFMDFGIIIWETDMYISSERFIIKSTNGNILRINKTLTYRYRYEPDNFYNVGWDYYYGTDSNEKVSRFISKQQADSILYSWGLSRSRL